MPLRRPKKSSLPSFGKPLFRKNVNTALKGKYHLQESAKDTKKGLKRAHDTFRGERTRANGSNVYSLVEHERASGYVDVLRKYKQEIAVTDNEIKTHMGERQSGVKGFLRWIFAGSTARKRVRFIQKIRLNKNK